MFVPEFHPSFYLAVFDFHRPHVHAVGSSPTVREDHLVPAAFEATGAVPGAIGMVTGAIAPIACDALESQLGGLGDGFFLEGFCGGFLASNEKKADVDHLAQLDLGSPAIFGRNGDKVAFHAALTTDGPFPVDICPCAGQAGAGGGVGGVDGGSGHDMLLGHGGCVEIPIGSCGNFLSASGETEFG